MLLDRCRPDSIVEFRMAVNERYVDGLRLAASSRGTAAIYLWGYCAEMTLKSAYFALIGHGEGNAITKMHLDKAKGMAKSLNFVWVGNLHNVESWAKLLANTRSSVTGLAYPTPAFGSDLLAKCHRLQRVWSEFLRYHRNVAYPHEIENTRRIVEWLMDHSDQL